jgi:Holliday junction resolvase RusA-like endonuclease
MNRKLGLFTIDGKPVPKQRPRFSMRSKRVYTPGKTLAAEERIRNLVSLEYSADPVAGPIYMMISFGMEIPKSWTKAKRQDALDGFLPHTSTPDLDNLIKLVTDALNGVLYIDDSQIVRIDAAKLYMPAPATMITATEYMGEM